MASEMDSKNKILRNEYSLIPCSRPILTIKELIEWQPSDPACRCHVPVFPRTTVGSNTHKTVVCHDNNRQYFDDRLVHGSAPPQYENYTFYNWQYIDMFIYFGHYFVTVPPLGWIAAAHRHGVPVLGTFMTEHDDDGEKTNKVCLEMLMDKATYLRIVDKLVDVAEHYNFDGWLINIENTVPENLVPHLLDFVRELKLRMGKRLRHSHVMWYDSVTMKGDLLWQNAVNENNRDFLEAADSIYLNYVWTDDNLRESAALARSLGRSGDVYVGIDVFGRGTRGGGGFNTVEALRCVRSADLSAVLFAVVWLLDKNEPSEIAQNEFRFWDSLHDMCPQHGTATLPLSSHFCRGRGHAFFYHGQPVSTVPWYNIAIQSLQPSFSDTQFRHHHISPVNMAYHMEEGFLGGGSLRLTTPVSADGHITIFKLFKTDIHLTETMFVSYAMKCTEVTDVFLELRLERQGVYRTVHLCENDPLTNKSGDHNTLTALGTEDATDVLGAYAYWMCLVGQQQWQTRCFVLDGSQVEGWKLVCVGIGVHPRIGTDCPTCDSSCTMICEALLGQIQINPVSLFSRHPPIIKDTVFTPYAQSTPPPVASDAPTNNPPHRVPISGCLAWNSDLPHEIDFCIIYVYSGLDLDNLTLLGQSCTNTFWVNELCPESDDLSFLIQPVLYSGFVESISMCCSISLDTDGSCADDSLSNSA